MRRQQSRSRHQFRSPHRAAITAAALAAAACTPQALAQSALGDFRPWVPSVPGGVATDPSDPAGFTILVDDDGDLFTPPVPYNLDDQAPELSFATNYQLSPSRNTLYVLQDDPNDVIPAQVWFVDLDGQGGVDVRHGPFSLTGQQGFARVAGGPYYYDSIGGLRTAVLVLENNNRLELWAQMFDLNTPDLSGRARVDLETGLGLGWFAPSGTHLVIKNGITDADTEFVDYTLINACGSGGKFGLNSDIRVSGSLIPPDPLFSVDRVGGGTIDVTGKIPGQPGVIFSGTLPDCGGTVAPEFGACCIDFGGGNVFCVDGLTRFECNQGVFTPNALCEDVCATPTVDVVGAAPTDADAGDEVTYTFTVTNSTGSLLENVPVFATAPTGTVITSVTAGGIVAGGDVDWILPSLGAGQSQAFTMSVQAPCAAGPMLLEGVAYGAILGFTIFNGTDLVTNVLGAPPVGIDLDSAPLAAPPLRQGDLVIHTITMTNTGGRPAEGITLDCFNLGDGVSLEQVIDDAGGTVVSNPCGENTLAWEGTVPAGQTRTLVFSTRIDCVSPSYPGGPLGVQLNRTVDIRVLAAEPCDDVLDTATPMYIEAVPPFTSSLEYAELTPGTLRFNPVDRPPYFDGTVIGLGRLGEEAEVVLTVENTNGPDLADVSAEYVLGGTFEAPADAPNDPFIGTPPAGVTFDAVTQTVRYSGPLVTGESVEIRLRLVMASADRPRDGVTLQTGAGCGAPSNTDRNARIYAVPPSPSVSHVYTVSDWDHYRYDAPFPGGVSARIPDFYIERLAGLGVGVDRSLYVADVLYSYVLNPDTLSFNVFEGAAVPQDTDPASGGVVHAGAKSVWRYFPDGTRELVYSDEDSALDIRRVTATTDGRFHLLLNNSATQETRIASIDPSAGGLPLDETALQGVTETPTVAYTFEGDFGPVLGRSILGITDDGTDLYALVRTVWDGTADDPGIIQFQALVRVEPGIGATAGTVEVVDAEVSAEWSADAPALPASADPILRQVPITGPVAYSIERGPVYVRRDNTALLSIDMDTRIPLGLVLPPPSGSTQGVAIVEVTCGRADLDQNGVLDLLDVALFGDLFGAGNPTVDFTGDGLFDLSDVNAFVDAFLAGCP